MLKRALYSLSVGLWLCSIPALQAQNSSIAIKGVTSKTDSKTNQSKEVLPDIKLTAGTTQKLDMVFATGVNYSFVPAHIAEALHAKKVGEIDLGQKDPEVPKSIGSYHMNQTGQTRFEIVQIDKFDLGVGPKGGPIQLLVLEDKNSDFGIIGHNWPLKGSKTKSYTFSYTDERYPKGALWYGPSPTHPPK